MDIFAGQKHQIEGGQPYSQRTAVNTFLIMFTRHEWTGTVVRSEVKHFYENLIIMNIWMVKWHLKLLMSYAAFTVFAFHLYDAFLRTTRRNHVAILECLN